MHSLQIIGVNQGGIGAIKLDKSMLDEKKLITIIKENDTVQVLDRAVGGRHAMILENRVALLQPVTRASSSLATV
ncbi:hypothetical protein F2Q68_00005129 [Brassica cretica]|uniref:Uncharacterized protein n=2 Tax=Brassica cretica TaxID=69181 RepID=A0A8S9P3T8_BRACR|nr:hypothetical protein F2Q68_00005129 [Brassica cretica]KAF3511808.1 hypothetical protein F2Q69_00007019 [Brassica cretica]KAF3545562.1 hypothetical protein DY000_02007763 [Brassica cretica]